MLLIAAALLASATDGGSRPTAAVRQAQVTVRIISAARVKLGSAAGGPGVPPVRRTTVRVPEGRHPAQLIEFQ
jgi:hypothetical protein